MEFKDVAFWSRVLLLLQSDDLRHQIVGDVTVPHRHLVIGQFDLADCIIDLLNRSLPSSAVASG